MADNGSATLPEAWGRPPPSLRIARGRQSHNSARPLSGCGSTLPPSGAVEPLLSSRSKSASRGAAVVLADEDGDLCIVPSGWVAQSPPTPPKSRTARASPQPPPSPEPDERLPDSTIPAWEPR